MMKRIIISATALVLWGGLAMAQTSNGDYNTALVNQEGTNSSEIIQDNPRQGVTGNYANVYQRGTNTGEGLGSNILQQGNFNRSYVSQFGTNGSAIFQGAPSGAEGEPGYGNRNLARVYQTGGANSPNTASIDQLYDRNYADQFQSGDGNMATIEQSSVYGAEYFEGYYAGYSNIAEQDQYGTNEAYISQEGELNIGHQVQSGHNKGTFESSNQKLELEEEAFSGAWLWQTGRLNQAYQVQAGALNLAEAHQVGSYNNLRQSQTGTANYAFSSQAGEGGVINNWAYQIQYGDNNAITLGQSGNHNVSAQNQGATYYSYQSRGLEYDLDGDGSVDKEYGSYTYSRGNFTHADQFGDGNVNIQLQYGTDNCSSVFQHGSNNVSLSTQIGFGNESNVTQWSDGNLSRVFQSGSNNQAFVLQK